MIPAPTVHLNGTSKRELLELLHNLASTLNVAGYEAAKAAPNARDYYVQGPDAYRLASAAWEDFRGRLSTLETEIGELYNAIDAQGAR